MTIAFAAAIGHAPGWVAWTDRAPAEQRASLAAAVENLKLRLEEARLDRLILLTSEHWTNFFLDHMSAFCIGVGASAQGPVEPWMKMDATKVPGDPDMARALLDAAYDAGIEPSQAHELRFDHGTMVPLKFLVPSFDIPVVPIFFNTLAPPQPKPSRCFALGEVIGAVAEASAHRIGIIATGGMSHDPGEVGHGHIDIDFDKRFLDRMERGDVDALKNYSIDEFAAAGAGTIELIAWVALAGSLGRFSGSTLAYEPVVGWATGMGVMALEKEAVPA